MPEFTGTFDVCGFRSFPLFCQTKTCPFLAEDGYDDRDRKFEGTRPLVNYNIDMDWETKPWWLFMYIYTVYIYILYIYTVYIYIELDACPILYMFFEALNDLCI